MGDVSDRIGRQTDNGQVLNSVLLHCISFVKFDLCGIPELSLYTDFADWYN